MEIKFYKCTTCGNVLIKLCDSNITPSCCGKYLTELKANTDETGKQEFHLPVVSRIDCSTVKVVVGKIEHPMTEQHYISFVYLQTDKGGQIMYLGPGKTPEAVFLTTDRPIAVYAYCNIHGLWKTEITEDKQCE